MNIKHIICLLLFLQIYQNSFAQSDTPGTCISQDEAKLLSLVNQYRQENQLPSISTSRSLMTVAQWHAEDAFMNGQTIFTASCNLHSWSNEMPQLWDGMCYTSDHAQASQMWNKPRQITNNAFTGNGYENAGYGYATIQSALEGWKNSPSHNDVILNNGIWANFPWKSMGVGVNTVGNNYYFLWFSDAADTAQPMPVCKDDVFKNSFES